MPENKEVLSGVQNEKKLIQKREETGLIDLDKGREAMVPREVKSWMEKIEEDPQQNQKQGQRDDDSVLQPIHKAKQRTLPVNKRTFSSGFNKNISNAGRWLSEFVLRIIKREKGKVEFNKE